MNIVHRIKSWLKPRRAKARSLVTNDYDTICWGWSIDRKNNVIFSNGPFYPFRHGNVCSSPFTFYSAIEDVQLYLKMHPLTLNHYCSICKINENECVTKSLDLKDALRIYKLHEL
jgi:hypothetical protein